MNHRTSSGFGGIDPFPAQHEAKTEKGLILKKICRVGFCQVKLTQLKSKGDLQNFGNVYLKPKTKRKPTVHCNERDREYKMKETCHISKILLVEFRLIKLFSFRSVLLSFKKKEPVGGAQ